MGPQARQEYLAQMRGRYRGASRSEKGRLLTEGRCCTNPHWPARCQPTGFSPADAIRHWSAEGGYPIQDFAAEDHLNSPARLGSGREDQLR